VRWSDRHALSTRDENPQSKRICAISILEVGTISGCYRILQFPTLPVFVGIG
jgi:hypothetical protein